MAVNNAAPSDALPDVHSTASCWHRFYCSAPLCTWLIWLSNNYQSPFPSKPKPSQRTCTRWAALGFWPTSRHWRRAFDGVGDARNITSNCTATSSRWCHAGTVRLRHRPLHRRLPFWCRAALNGSRHPHPHRLVKWQWRQHLVELRFLLWKLPTKVRPNRNRSAQYRYWSVGRRCGFFFATDVVGLWLIMS